MRKEGNYKIVVKAFVTFCCLSNDIEEHRRFAMNPDFGDRIQENVWTKESKA